jgi:hypothetical protein
MLFYSLQSGDLGSCEILIMLPVSKIMAKKSFKKSPTSMIIHINLYALSVTNEQIKQDGLKV